MPPTASPGAVPVRGTAANLRPVADGGHVAEPDGRAAGADRDHALLEILQFLDVAAPAQDVFATGELEHACADFRVGVADRPRDVRHRQPEAHQPIRIDDDLVLPLEAAERRDFRHTGDRLERRADREILQGAQFGEIHPSGAVFQHVLIDPAHATRIGPERRRYPWWQELLDPSQLLEHACPRPVDVGALAEEGIREAHAEHRVAADRLHARRTLQRAHERVGDLVLDQVGAAAHPLGVDDDLRVREIRQRIKWCLACGVGREQREHEHRAEDHPLMTDRQLDDAFDHGRYSLSAEALAEAGR